MKNGAFVSEWEEFAFDALFGLDEDMSCKLHQTLRRQIDVSLELLHLGRPRNTFLDQIRSDNNNPSLLSYRYMLQ